ncbi:MAG: hypothetical protein AUH13_12165 [Acidobacteria bacterium 13_2_20CM_58_27]|nr:MAG: hypothetical protein AUH13_12165 [Acidobacteria bacterium 13_2_20CM_58_27]
MIGSPVDSRLASKKEEKYTHEGIARLAYELWERRGRPRGSPEIDWYAAETALGVQDSREEFSLAGVRFEPEEGAYRER